MSSEPSKPFAHQRVELTGRKRCLCDPLTRLARTPYAKTNGGAIVRRIFGLGVVAVLVLTACGKSSNGPASGGSPTQRSSAGTATLAVNTMKITGVGAVLVDSGGFTLYHLQGETTSTLKCTGSCLSTWPPLLDNSGATPTRGAGVTGTLSTFSPPTEARKSPTTACPCTRLRGTRRRVRRADRASRTSSRSQLEIRGRIRIDNEGQDQLPTPAGSLGPRRDCLWAGVACGGLAPQRSQVKPFVGSPSPQIS